MIIPSIDLMNGKAVQLINGDENKLMAEVSDPIALARRFNLFGEVAVIDLDAAFSKGNNETIIQQICRVADCRVGGGIRTIEKGEELLRNGAQKIIIGTKADPDFLSSFNKDQVIVALDMKNGHVATEGWKKLVKENPIERAINLQDYCSEFLFTDVEKEGLMSGINFEMAKQIRTQVRNQLTYAGGIGSIEEIVALEREGINSQIGMAIYTERFSLEDAFLAVLDFEKGNGFLPTIVEDEFTREVLMLAYSTKESLKFSFNQIRGENFAHYFSRSRKKIWKKGEISGNVQKLVKVRYDCDRDTLLFRVKQYGKACHKETRNCFSTSEFNLSSLEKIIQRRKNQEDSRSSFTQKILQQEGLIELKLQEELDELINYSDKQNLVWEAADLIYFFLAYLAREGVSLKEVENELWRRNKS